MYIYTLHTHTQRYYMVLDYITFRVPNCFPPLAPSVDSNIRSTRPRSHTRWGKWGKWGKWGAWGAWGALGKWGKWGKWGKELLS